MDRGDYILTYSNSKFYPVDPQIDEIIPGDIAHALSLLCRANGHFKRFYSVAQHSINCSIEAEKLGYSRRVQLACLLHDGSEAYISDITRPVKRYLKEYVEIERQIQGEIWKAFGLEDLSDEEHKKVEDIDNAILYYEFTNLHGSTIYDTEPYISMKHDFSFRDMNEVEKEFVDRLGKLINNS